MWDARAPQLQRRGQGGVVVLLLLPLLLLLAGAASGQQIQPPPVPPADLPDVERQLNNLTDHVATTISDKFRFCVADPIEDWNEAFNYTSDLSFVDRCLSETRAGMCSCSLGICLSVGWGYADASPRPAHVLDAVAPGAAHAVSGCAGDIEAAAHARAGDAASPSPHASDGAVPTTSSSKARAGAALDSSSRKELKSNPRLLYFKASARFSSRRRGRPFRRNRWPRDSGIGGDETTDLRPNMHALCSSDRNFDLFNG